MKGKKPIVAFIGQGYVGGSYANNFEKRGYQVIRYSLEEPYIKNKDKVKTADIVFVCVPTPTTPKGFDGSIVQQGLSLVGRGKIAVIKSTLLPGSTALFQKKFPNIVVLCSPEFLSVTTAQQDADRPFSNIIGIPKQTDKYQAAAEEVMLALPEADFSLICSSQEAEIIKYAHNLSGYTQILAFNLMYDMAKKMGAEWQPIQDAIMADPLIPNRYSNPVHKSGRGAGGECFVKDMAAFARLYKELGIRPEGTAFLDAAQKKNIALLTETGKDLFILQGVYGDKVVSKKVLEKAAQMRLGSKRTKRTKRSVQ